TLKLADDLYSQLDTIHNKCQFKLVIPYMWENAGSAQVVSDWVGNMGDGETVAPSPIGVPVQRATNYVGNGQLYRLNSLYYYLEPDYAEEGYGIQFVLDTDGNPVKLNPAIQMMGESDPSYGDFALGCWGDGANNTFFTKDGDTYTIEAQVLCNDGTTSWYMTGMMEYIMFTLSK
ncbi:MAG: hypothetical protein K2M65_04450, partial [Muribaculaceae bacterium]|nr:hypothetical protein [Muribaculaceae bacterium]